LAAAIALVGEVGPAAVTVRGLSRASGVSTGTFYEHFRNVDECVAAALDWATGRALSGVAELGGSDGGEPDLEARVRLVLEWVARERRQSRLLLVDCYGTGRALRVERRRAERRFEAALAPPLGVAPGKSNPSLRGTVAAITHAARAQLAAGEGSDRASLASELESWAASISEPRLEIAPRPGTGHTSPSRGVSPRNLGRVNFGDDRTRVLDAVTKLAVEHGYHALSGPRIRTQAGVARRRFDRLFADVDQCFLEAVERLVLTLVAEAGESGAVAGSWPAGVTRGSETVCRELALRPAVARLTLVEILEAGQTGLRRREELITHLAERLRSSASPDRQAGRLGATASVAASWRILEAEVLAGRERRLPRLAPTIARTLMAPAYAVRRAPVRR
jgi:AcrR family transcriptional regulator